MLSTPTRLRVREMPLTLLEGHAEGIVFWQNFHMDQQEREPRQGQAPGGATGERPVPRAAQPPDARDGAVANRTPSAHATPGAPREIGGREGPDPTRYGDWELRGRCIDF